MTKCICGKRIIKYPILKDGKPDELWLHPINLKGEKCMYSDEGIQLVVVDPLIQSKYVQLVKEEYRKTLWGRFILYLESFRK